MNRNSEMHLTVEEIKDFILEELSEEAELDVDKHIESCVECAQQLEDFYTAQEEFPAAQWAAQRGAFVASLREQIFGPRKSALERLSEWFEIDFRYLIPVKIFDSPLEPIDLESDDEAFGIFISPTEDDGLMVSFATSEMELEGMAIRFRAGAQTFDAPPLRKISDDHVGTDIVISKDERMAMPKGTTLTAELIA